MIFGVILLLSNARNAIPTPFIPVGLNPRIDACGSHTLEHISPIKLM